MSVTLPHCLNLTLSVLTRLPSCSISSHISSSSFQSWSIREILRKCFTMSHKVCRSFIGSPESPLLYCTNIMFTLPHILSAIALHVRSRIYFDHKTIAEVEKKLLSLLFIYR
ncbi:hypothetical protein F5051DRAFT_149278 [Lentinula edodes]|nr:hypothetical protein F5051DRAFT_149278 [Lentinula edodes]